MTSHENDQPSAARQGQWIPGAPIAIPIKGSGLGSGWVWRAGGGRTLYVSPEGLAMTTTKVGNWQLGWNELSQIVITTAYHQRAMFGWKMWRVRMIMDVADPGVVQRHPELVNFEGKFGGTGSGSYGVPLGPVHNLVDQLAHALGYYGRSVFRGVISKGQVVGFGYM